MGRIKALVLTADYPPATWSGIGAAVEYQARALAALGVNVDVLVAASPPAALAPQPTHGDSTPSEAQPRVVALGRSKFPVDWHDCDVIHLHSLALSELAFELRRRAHKPLVYTAHSLLWLELPPGPRAELWCEVQQSVLASADHVVFLSQAERSAALSRMPDLEGRSTVIPNGVPEPPPLSLEGVPEDGPIVFAGRFARSKGLELLGELVPCFRKQFVFAGGHGDAVGQGIVQQLCRRLPRRCTSAGWLARDQLEQLFSTASLVVVPSLYEPGGLVALEAMRMGAPVLAAAVGGLVDVVGPDSGGRLVRSTTVSEWQAGVEAIVSDPTTRRQLRSRGRRHVRDRFASRPMAKRLMTEVYAA